MVMNGNVFIFICLETWKLGLFGPLCYECGYVHVCPVCEHMCVSVKVLLAGIRTFFFLSWRVVTVQEKYTFLFPLTVLWLK